MQSSVFLTFSKVIKEKPLRIGSFIPPSPLLGKERVRWINEQLSTFRSFVSFGVVADLNEFSQNIQTFQKSMMRYVSNLCSFFENLNWQHLIQENKHL